MSSITDRVSAIINKKKTDGMPRYVALMHQETHTSAEVDELAALRVELGISEQQQATDEAAIISVRQETANLYSAAQIAEADRDYNAWERQAKESVKEAAGRAIDAADDIVATVAILKGDTPLGARLSMRACAALNAAVESPPVNGKRMRDDNRRTWQNINDTKRSNPRMFPEVAEPAPQRVIHHGVYESVGA